VDGPATHQKGRKSVILEVRPVPGLRIGTKSSSMSGTKEIEISHTSSNKDVEPLPRKSMCPYIDL